MKKYESNKRNSSVNLKDDRLLALQAKILDDKRQFEIMTWLDDVLGMGTWDFSIKYWNSDPNDHLMMNFYITDPPEWFEIMFRLKWS